MGFSGSEISYVQVISKANTCRRVLFSKLNPFYRAHMGQKEADVSKTISLAYTTAPAFGSVDRKSREEAKITARKGIKGFWYK